MMRLLLHRQRGFTLIELMVTLTILAVLASVALPLTQVAAKRSRENELRRALWTIRDGIDAYKRAFEEGRIRRSADDTGYPPSLAVLETGVTDQRDNRGPRIFFVRRIPRDPTCDCPERSNIDTWGVRSYASTADNPQPGRDVYDVHSLSLDLGSNGIPYRQW
ncbi:type II secretion system protein [Niveibacterium umoris]|uniref:General secretion pathway protein G n=1 Tax=Niveibacterium umoris TaxID=1193620 RepID=A0A840BCP3_9RHOO|nr:type II secretion system protein [Niveibacterium umoris]MBB4010800.1 general secretion pathway protein G [Niveibacterium umoris]